MYDAGLLEREVKRYNENFVNKVMPKNKVIPMVPLLTLTEFLIKLFHSKRVTTLLESSSSQPQWEDCRISNDGVKLGVSSRGVGTLSQPEKVIV